MAVREGQAGEAGLPVWGTLYLLPRAFPTLWCRKAQEALRSIRSASLVSSADAPQAPAQPDGVFRGVLCGDALGPADHESC